MWKYCPIGQANNWKCIGGRGSQCKLFLPKQLCLSWLWHARLSNTRFFGFQPGSFHTVTWPCYLQMCWTAFRAILGHLWPVAADLTHWKYLLSRKSFPIPLHLIVKPQSTVRPINNHSIRAETVSGEGCGSLTHQWGDLKASLVVDWGRALTTGTVGWW